MDTKPLGGLWQQNEEWWGKHYVSYQHGWKLEIFVEANEAIRCSLWDGHGSIIYPMHFEKKNLDTLRQQLELAVAPKEEAA